MKTYEEALDLVLASTVERSPQLVPLTNLLGRVTSEPVRAPIALPPFDNSAVDGYALRARDAGREILPIAGVAAAGSKPASLVPGTAMRIFTGAPIPEGADAVVMQEDVDIREGGIHIQPDAALGHLRREAEEVREGDVVFPGNTLVTPPVLGALATLGIDRLRVFSLPRVQVVGTGSELVSPGEPLAPGQVYESNTYGVAAALQSIGLPDVGHKRVRDDLEETRNAFAAALEESDVLIVCGGVSVGEHDLVRPVLRDLAVGERLWRVKIKPGKPFYFGIGPSGQHVFGLPGNPVSALVVFTLFVRPALRKMVGLPAERWFPVPLMKRMPPSPGRDEFLRAELSQEGARPLQAQGSQMLTGLAVANALIRIPADGRAREAGEMIDATRLSW
jgi:molybdopterin molybdotransferase